MSTSEKNAAGAPRADAMWDRYAFRVLGASALLTLVLGTVVYQLVEQWDWVDAFYFSVVALTTVGFGDLHPTTTFSKLFTVFYIFFGISLIGAYLNALLKRNASRIGQRGSRR
jgi:hypothetical protein